MTRKEMLEILNSVKNKRDDLTRHLLRDEKPLPEWLWKDYDNEKDLLDDLKKDMGEDVKLIWLDGLPYVIRSNKKRVPKWFGQ